MSFRFFPSLVAAGFALALAGCTSSPQVNPDITNALQSAGVTGPTYAKVSQGAAVDFNDILSMVEKGVPAHIIESYLQSTEKTYQFSQGQLGELRSAGATPQLMNYLSESGGFYNPRPASPTGVASIPGQRARTVNSPLYQDEQPFAYNAPAVDSWYNSAYEESLYSPFSFDAD